MEGGQESNAKAGNCMYGQECTAVLGSDMIWQSTKKCSYKAPISGSRDPLPCAKQESAEEGAFLPNARARPHALWASLVSAWNSDAAREKSSRSEKQSLGT